MATATAACSWRPDRAPSTTFVSPDTTVAANSDDSLSGWVSLQAATVGVGRPWPGRIHWTGAHIESVRAVRAADADLASIDELTWAHLRRLEPGLVDRLHVVGRGPWIPSPAIVTSTGRVDELRHGVRRRDGGPGHPLGAGGAAARRVRPPRSRRRTTRRARPAARVLESSPYVRDWRIRVRTGAAGERGAARLTLPAPRAAPVRASPGCATAPTEVVSADELESIHDASLRILAEIGMNFLDAEARRPARRRRRDRRRRRRRGCASTRRWSSRRSRTCPSEFRLHSWNPAHTLTIGGDHIAFGSVGSPPNVVDLDGVRRPGDPGRLPRPAQAVPGVQHRPLHRRLPGRADRPALRRSATSRPPSTC